MAHGFFWWSGPFGGQPFGLYAGIFSLKIITVIKIFSVSVSMSQKVCLAVELFGANMTNMSSFPLFAF